MKLLSIQAQKSTERNYLVKTLSDFDVQTKKYSKKLVTRANAPSNLMSMQAQESTVKNY